MSFFPETIQQNIDQNEQIDDELKKVLSEMNERQWDIMDFQQVLLPYLTSYYDQELLSKAFTKLSIKKVESIHEEQLIFIINTKNNTNRELIEVLTALGVHIVNLSNVMEAYAMYFYFDADCIILSQVDTAMLTIFNMIDEVKERYIPTVVLNDNDKEHDRVMSYSIGVDDFIANEIEVNELIVRVNNQLKRKKRLDQLIYIDSLTKVYNRKFLTAVYKKLIAQIYLTEKPLCMALIDFDYFKDINDTFGHLKGDKVLTTLVKELKKGIKKDDIIIRFGGEEFIILFQNTPLSQAIVILENILQSFSKITFSQDNKQIKCTFSAGVHEIVTEHLDLKYNIKKVNQLLSIAKKNGRNQLQY